MNKFPTEKQFLTWIEKQSSDDTYDYTDIKDCLMARFLNDSKIKFDKVGGSSYYVSEKVQSFPDWFRKYSPIVSLSKNMGEVKNKISKL